MQIENTGGGRVQVDLTQTFRRNRSTRYHRAQHAKPMTMPQASEAMPKPAAAPTTAKSPAAVTDAAQLTRPAVTSEPPPNPGTKREQLMGDMNGDGKVDQADVDAFVLALSDRAAYVAQYGEENYANGDFKGSGTITFADINPFREALSQGIKA